MRNRVNNLRVFIPKSGRKKTNYPTIVHDDNGAEQLVTVSMADSEFNNVPTEDFSLQNLLRAGVSPENMRVNTSSFNAVNNIQNFDRSVTDFINSIPVEENAEN